MCLICIDLEKDTLKPYEAFKNLDEMRSGLDDEHIEIVNALILEKIIKQLDVVNVTEEELNSIELQSSIQEAISAIDNMFQHLDFEDDLAQISGWEVRLPQWSHKP